MAKKDVRNMIITLVILAGGIFAIMRYAVPLIKGRDTAGVAGDFIGLIESSGTLLVYGIAAIIVLLVIYYFSMEDKNALPDRPRPVR